MVRHLFVSVCLVLGLAATATAQVRLEGRVNAADGSPLAGATVRLNGMDTPPLSATTDAGGRYSFPSVKGTWVTVVVWSEGRPVAEGSGLVTRPVEVMDFTAKPISAEPRNRVDLDPYEGAAGTVAGTVRSTTGEPVPGARVVVGITDVSTTTDSFGRYDFGRIRAGLSVELVVSAAGFTPARRRIEVRSAERTVTDFAIDALATPSAPQGRLSVVETPADNRSVAFATAAATGFAATRSGDVVRALQMLPGVSASLEAPSEFVVRGSAPDQTLMTFEGMTLYPFSGLRGFFGGFDGAAVRRVDVAEAALTPSESASAGSIEMFGAADGIRRPTGFFEGSAFGIGGRVAAPLGSRGSVVVAARRDPFDRLYRNVLDRYTSSQGLFVPDRPIVWNGGALMPAPTPGFHDVTATVTLSPTTRDRVSASVYDARDAANLSRNLGVDTNEELAEPNPNRLPGDAVAEVSEAYEWKGRGQSASWRRQWSSLLTTAVSYARTEFSRERADASVLRDAATGQNYSTLAFRGGSAARRESNSIAHTGVRFSADVNVGRQHGLNVGMEINELDATYIAAVERLVTGATTPVALIPSGNQIATARVVRLFAEDVWRPTSRVVLAVGSRFSHHELDPGLQMEPSVSATYTWLPSVNLIGGWSITRQQAVRVVREDRLRGDTDFWALVNGSSIKMPRTEQLTGGMRVQGGGWFFEGSGYFKRFDDVTMFAPVHTTSLVGAIPDPTLHTGTGRAAGITLALQGETPRNDLWVGYRGGRTVYTYPTLGAGTFVAPFDRLHEFKVTDTLRLTSSWSTAVTWVAASGLPTTSVLRNLVWLPTGQEAYRTSFGNKNTSRLPAYGRLDVSTEMVFRTGRVSSTIGVSAYNVLKNENVRGRTYDTIGQSVVPEDVNFIGRAFNAFLRVGF